MPLSDTPPPGASPLWRAPLRLPVAVEPSDVVPFGTVDGAPPDRPVLTLHGEEIHLADLALRLLGFSDCGLYVRARHLVRVSYGTPRPGGGIARDATAPVIELIDAAILRERLARVADWRKKTAKGDQEILPPPWMVEMILACQRWPFPVLEGVVDAPTLRPDGSVLAAPGYDPLTGLLLHPSGRFPAVPDRPTPADCAAARTALEEPFRDFPFRDAGDLSAALAAVLSLVARPAIPGCVPLFAVRATTPGTGKGLLADVVCLIGTGRPGARMTPEADDTEMRKRVLSIALAGDAVVLLDNVEGALGSPALAAALTSETFKDRILGASTMAEAPLRAVWISTGNNTTFRGDLGRRVVPIDLVADREHPEDRAADEFAHPDLLAWVVRHRPPLVTAALTLLRAYHVAGRPRGDLGPRFGSFESWDALVRGCVVWCGYADPLAGRTRLRAEDDTDRVALAGALRALRDAYGPQAFTARDAVDRATEMPALREALLDFASYRDGLHAQRLGTAFKKAAGRIVDGLSVQRAFDAHAKTATWCVVEHHI